MELQFFRAVTILLPLNMTIYVSWHPTKELEDFVIAKFYCLLAVAGGN